jgi:F0F1-type ATP synthase gamma subunit
MTETILADLLPRNLTMQIFRAMLENHRVGEQARPHGGDG